MMTARLQPRQRPGTSGEALDLNESKGRKNRAALVDSANSAKDFAAATATQTGSQDAANAALERGRNALIKQAEKFGLTRAQAEAYADKLGLIPENVYTAAKLNTADVDRQMIDWRGKWKDFKIKLQVGGGGARMEARAGGGILPGAPSNTDNMLAVVASGEFIVRARQVAVPRTVGRLST